MAWNKAANTEGDWVGITHCQNFKMAAGEAIELSQLPIPQLENLRSQLEEASCFYVEESPGYTMS